MPSKRSKKMPPFLVMDILETAQELEKQGKQVIHLEIGEPDFETPEIIKQAAIESLKKGETKYTHSQGLPELREAICNHYREKYGVSIIPEQVVVTSGTSPAIFLAISSLIEPGEEIIIADPSYACYKNIIEFADGVPVTVEIFDNEGYQLTAESVKKKITSKTKAIIINSPSNPTGTTLSRETLMNLADLAEKYGLFILSDEIYHELTYEGEEISALEVTEQAFVFNGFSKAYAMTGWRLGYVIAPKSFVRPLQKIQQNLFICAANFTQHAGVAALIKGKSFVEKMRREYDKRRKYIVPELRKLGFEVKTFPQGAFYVLANAQRFTSSSYDFSLKILKKVGVAVAPGIDFGKNAEGFLRFSYANSLENIQEALSRLKYLERLK